VKRKSDGKFFACKVIRPVQRYIESAVIEAQIIERVQSLDKEGVSRCIRIVEHFQFTEKQEAYYAIIFEILGKSLYDFLQANSFRGNLISSYYRFSLTYHQVIRVSVTSVFIILAWNKTYAYRSKGKVMKLSSRKIFCW